MTPDAERIVRRFGEEMFEEIAAKMEHPDENRPSEQAMARLKEMFTSGVLLGFKSYPVLEQLLKRSDN